MIVTPATATLDYNKTIQLTATLKWSDGSNTNITDTANWSSDQNSTVAKGLVKAIGKDKTIVTVTHSGYKATAVITITPIPVGLKISPEVADIEAGQNGNFQAFEIFSDESSADVTDLADWELSDVEFASVSKGVVTTHKNKPGLEVLRARYNNRLAQADITITGELPKITYNKPKAIPARIEMPQKISITVDETQQIPVTLIYSDETSEKIEANLTANNPKVMIDKDIITGVDKGTSIITATYDKFKISSVVFIKARP